MRIAFVVPRYGPAIIGGAETAARLLAEHLVALKGWEVDVLTTCAEDFVTWDDIYEPGEEWIGGVRVERHLSAAGREPSFHPLSAALLADPVSATVEEAERWLDLQGPVAPALATAAASWDGDAMVFYPYLYWPTVRVIDQVAVPTVLHPAAHDEPALRLPIFPEVFAAADALVFQTEAERHLVEGMFAVASHHQLLLGLGVDDPDDRAHPDHRDRDGHPSPMPDTPYLMCLGRIDDHKGTTLLASYFARYKERHPGPLRLVLAGPVVEAPAAHPDIDVVGPVTEDDKWDLLGGATALVSPSPWEAFSLVVAEAWSARTPVLVNAGCAATVEHCRRSGGGLRFDGYGEFEVAVDRLVADGSFGTGLGKRGRAYVDARFRWPLVIDRYASFVTSVVARGGRTAGRPAGRTAGRRTPTT
ncbi:MAG TPA: glycosyltransferase family 4 protein [Acidimicrobiales bacterium]